MNTCKEGEKKVLRKINGEKKRICVPQTTLRKKCPKGTINYKENCINKKDKPKGTRGRPKTPKPVGQQTKTPQQKKTQAQAAQLVGKDVVMKIKKEIQAFYDSISKKYKNAREDPNPFEGFYMYFSEIYIETDHLNKMKTFIRISGLSQEELTQIRNNVMAKYRFDECSYDDYRNPYDYDPLDYSIKMFDMIIDNKSFPKDPTVKDDLKNYRRESTKTIKGKLIL